MATMPGRELGVRLLSFTIKWKQQTTQYLYDHVRSFFMKDGVKTSPKGFKNLHQ
jgi:hypothetical protein